MSATSMQCVGCGGSLDLSSAIPVVLSCACHNRGATTQARIDQHGGFCGDPCRNLAARRRVARMRKCVHCGVEFDDGHIDPQTGLVRTGRPSVYCTDECRSAEGRARETAMRELAKGKMQYRSRGEYVDAVGRAEGLLEFWCGRAPTRPTEAPPEDAKQALRDRIADLREAVAVLDREAYEDEQRDLEQRRKEGWVANREKQAAADKAWRARVLKMPSEALG